MKQRIVLATVAVAAMALCLLIAGAAAGAGFLYFTTTSTVSEAPLPPTVVVATIPAAEAIPATEAAPTRPEPAPITKVDRETPTETERLLAETEVPERDLRLLASQLKYGGR